MIETFTEDLRYEKDVMKHLVKHPGDFQRAFSRVPPRIQTLFVHSYQSYLFNCLLSLRAKSGISVTTPEPGDFVMQLDITHSGRDSWLFTTDRNLEDRREQVNRGEYGLALAVPGYSTKTPPSKQAEMLQDLLKMEEVTLREFRNPESRSLDSPGGLHLTSIQIPDMTTSCIDDGVIAEFKLRKGSYATIVMREMMKNHPINRV